MPYYSDITRLIPTILSQNEVYPHHAYDLSKTLTYSHHTRFHNKTYNAPHTPHPMLTPDLVLCIITPQYVTPCGLARTFVWQLFSTFYNNNNTDTSSWHQGSHHRVAWCYTGTHNT